MRLGLVCCFRECAFAAGGPERCTSLPHVTSVSLSPESTPSPPCVLSPDFTESTGPESGSAASLAVVRLLRRSALPCSDQQLRPVLADLVDRQLHLALDLEASKLASDPLECASFGGFGHIES